MKICAKQIDLELGAENNSQKTRNVKVHPYIIGLRVVGGGAHEFWITLRLN